MAQPSLITVIVYRRNYGRRYTDLPVDQLDHDGLIIDCTGTFTRPEHYDLRPADIVRWRQGDRYIEAVITTVQRTPTTLQVTLAEAHLLPPEFFPY